MNGSLNEHHVHDILESVLERLTGDAAEAVLHERSYTSLRLAENAVTQSLFSSDATLSVTTAFGASRGSASTNDLRPEAVKALVERAEAAARVSPPDPEYMPPVEAAETARYVNSEPYDASTAAASPEATALELGEAIGRVEAAGARLSGSYRVTSGAVTCANSAGLRARERSTLAQLNATVLAATGSGWAEALSHRLSDVDTAGVIDRALDIALRSRDPEVCSPGRYTVILTPAAVAELLMFLFWGAFDAKATDEGRTCMRGKLGATVCGKNITLRSDPADPRCPAATFVEDGQAAPRLSWIADGVLENLCYSRYWASRQGRPAVARPTNLIMDGGEGTLDELVRATDRGILVTRFWYIRFVDPMGPLATGMTRDGLFEIVGGRVTRPLRQMRFNENLLDLLRRVDVLGAVERTEGFLGHYPNVLAPALRITGFNFTDVTGF